MKKMLGLVFLISLVFAAPVSFAKPVSDDTFFHPEEMTEPVNHASGDELPGDRGNALAEEEAHKTMQKNNERHWYNLISWFRESKGTPTAGNPANL